MIQHIQNNGVSNTISLRCAIRSVLICMSANLMAAHALAQSGLPGVIELSELNSAGNPSGIIINGTDTDDYAGYSVSSAGDFNDDGLDDFVIGAPGIDANNVNNAGATYVVFGGTSLPDTIDLSSLPNSPEHPSMLINGIDIISLSGISVGSIDDINGDGIDDLLIGARATDANGIEDSGVTYVIYGRTDPPASIELSSLGDSGIVINGIEPGDGSGDPVSDAGDINGDGINDLLIGAFFANRDNATNRGEAYIVYGDQNLPEVISLSALNTDAADSAAGIVLTGRGDRSYFGGTLGAAGDINNDGFQDFLIAAYLERTQAGLLTGVSYLFYGSNDLPEIIDVDELNGTSATSTPGVEIHGKAFSRSGRGFSGIGDFNGDLIDDLVVGASFAPPAGETYVIFGSTDLPGLIQVSELNTTGLNSASGITIFGIPDSDRSGHTTSSANDINDDGLADILIGARYASPNGRNDAGEAYLIYGDDNPPEEIQLSSLESVNNVGVRMLGIDDNDFAGISVSDAGDVNADGALDIIVGAYGATQNGNTSAGQAYIIFGAVTDLEVSVGNNIEYTDGNEAIFYSITVRNIGTGNVNGASVSDAFSNTLDSNTATWTCAPDANASCTLSGIGPITDSIELPIGTSVEYTLSVDAVANEDESISYSVNVASPLGLNEPNLSNNSATDIDIVALFAGGFENLENE